MTKEHGIKMGSIGFDEPNKSYVKMEENLKRRRKRYEDPL